MSTRLNAFKTLSLVGPVVSLHDLEVAAGISRQHAIQIAYKWRLAGYLEPFAEEVYFNVMRHPKARDEHIQEAVEKTLHRPYILIGLSSLNEAGWTTQRPMRVDMAVAKSRTVRTWKSMSGINAEARSVKWFNVSMDNSFSGTDGFIYLKPGYALVDAIVSKRLFAEKTQEQRELSFAKSNVIWHPDPDDISIDDPEAAVTEIAEATVAYKADADVVRDFIEAHFDLTDHLDRFDQLLGDFAYLPDF